MSFGRPTGWMGPRDGCLGQAWALEMDGPWAGMGPRHEWAFIGPQDRWDIGIDGHCAGMGPQHE